MTTRTLLRPYPQASVAEAYPARRWVNRAVIYLVLGTWSLFLIYALGWILSSSLKSNSEISSAQFLPSQLHLENYIKAWTTLNMGRYTLNSLIYVSLSIILLLAVCTPAAYVLSRFDFRGKRWITNLVISGMGIPTPLLFLPLFVLFTRLHLSNTVPGIVLTYVGVSVPFTVYLLTGFFATLPKEMEEAAVMDGCSSFKAFWYVMLPLAQPGILTAAILNFISMWNEFQWALIFVNTTELRTISLGLYSMRNAMQYSADWAGLYAGVVLVMIPTIILYVFLSERMIAGITMGSIKS